MKRHALPCYLKYGQPNWPRCSDHVNYTLAKLHLQLSSTIVGANNEADYERSRHRNEGLQLLRKNASKGNFFNELLKEVAKENRLLLPRDLFDVDFPFCRFIQVRPIEGAQVVKDRQQCFVDEPLHFSLTLYNDFRLAIQDFRLLCNSTTTATEAIRFQLDEASESTVQCCLRPQTEGEFEVYGFEFETSNVSFVHRFDERLVQRQLRFQAVEALPPIQVRLHVNEREVDALELFTGELVELSISLQPLDGVLGGGDAGWEPAEIRLSTNAKLEAIADQLNNGGVSDSYLLSNQQQRKKSAVFDDLSEWMNFDFGNRTECQFPLRMNRPNRFRMQSPSDASNNSIYLKVEYANERQQRCRTVTKTLELYVRECVQMERCGSEQVLSVRNVMSLNELNIRVGQQRQTAIRLDPGLTGFFLIGAQDRRISWTSQNRCGLIDLP